MNERTKHFYIWISLITFGVVVCLLSLLKIADFRRGEDVSLMESAFNRVRTVFQLQNKLLTYQSKDKALSFQYPKKLTLTEKLNKVELSHQIPYKNNGDCNMKGDNEVFDYLTDFKASFEIFNGTVKQAVLKYSPYMPVENFKGDTLKINSGFIDACQVGNLSGFSIYEGVEGCGHVIYYFPIKDNQTLIVEKAMIQALSPVIVKEERDKVLKVPGVITPEESEQIFEKILKSVLISPPQDVGRGGGEVDTSNWKTYRNEKYGFELKYSKIYAENELYSIWTHPGGAVDQLDEWGVNKGQETIFTITVYPKKKKTEVLQYFGHKVIDEQVTINGEVASKLLGMGVYDELIFENENYIYIIYSSFSSTTSTPENQEFHNILNSLKFTK